MIAQNANPSFVQWAASVLFFFAGTAALAAPLKLTGHRCSFSIDPATLRVDALPVDLPAIALSAGVPDPFRVARLLQDGRGASWDVPGAGMKVEFHLDANDALVVRFTSDRSGNFTWPILEPDKASRGYILPMFEGLYVPADDEAWARFLEAQGSLNTTEGLSMPFWGIDAGKFSVTFLCTNPFNNEIQFSRGGGNLGLRFTHEFTPNHAVKEFGFRIELGDASPVAPAKAYRRQLLAAGQLITLRQKIERTPEAAKLCGAAHVYLWGDGMMARDDVPDFKALARRIVEEAHAAGGSVGKRLWSLLSEEDRQRLTELPTRQWADHYETGQVIEALNRLLESRDFYTPKAWAGVTFPDEAATLLKTGIAALSDGQVCRLNCLLLHAAYPTLMRPVDSWGDGWSVRMMQTFAAAGLDRLWLGAPSWKSLANHPATVEKARTLGYLVGPYDSYNSIHSPTQKDTWETAQFDQALYDSGAVITKEGKPKAGFGQKGYILSPLAARPYVERRITRLMGQFRCNSWFMDCDAFGDLFDDYSPAHPATQQEDMNARLSRLQWIDQTFHAVVGSEGGSAYAAPAIHFAHGIMTPVIGWGDPEMTKQRDSKYYLGGYYPPDDPAVFMKQVPMKPDFHRVYADPRFRLPLYETVFHDSVVATHQWGFGSLKFDDPDHARELLELLYNVPPLYHLNLEQWHKQGKSIAAHYRFFSPLHRETATLPMTDFRWLSEDRLVQRTVFGDRIEMVANFSEEPFVYEKKSIPSHGVMSRRLDKGSVQVYQP